MLKIKLIAHGKNSSISQDKNCMYKILAKEKFGESYQIVKLYSPNILQIQLLLSVF